MSTNVTFSSMVWINKFRRKNYDQTITKDNTLMDLSRLHKALSTYEVAEHIFKVDNGKTLGEALALLQDANEEAGDPLSLKNALKNTPNARGKDPIVMGANPSKVGLHTAGDDKFKPKDGTKAFQTAADKVQRISRGLANEDQLPDHRTVNKGELGWIKRKPSADQLATVKKAALKSITHQRESAYSVNEGAMAILRAHVALKEANTTPAARTIETHKAPSAHDPRIAIAAGKITIDSGVADVNVQKNVADANVVALRFPSYSNTQSHFPPEFVASTIKRPTDIAFKDNYLNDQGTISANRPEAKPKTVRHNEGKGTLPQHRGGKANNGEPQQFPREPTGDGGSNIESGRGYY